MAILVDAASRLLVQGITGRTGGNIAARLKTAGSPVVGGVTPGRGGATVGGIPVFASCAAAVATTGADCSFVAVPAPAALDAACEAIDAGIRLCVVYTDGIALADTIRLAAFARSRGAVVIGPNAAGCVSPGKANLSDLNDDFLMPGPVGIVSKSGAITYEIAEALRRRGIGTSTIVCLGGDPVLGTRHAEILERFAADEETRTVVLVGEIGGTSESEAAPIVARMGKPVVAHILGRHAPRGRPMGHSGALLGEPGESASAKTEALREAGAHIAERITDIADSVAGLLER